MCCVIDGNCVNSSFNATFIDILTHNFAEVRQRRQYIYPDMNFTCNGTITKWIYGARNKNGVMLPELQIWRPLGSDYIKVGSSSVTANTSIGTNLYEFIPQMPLEFQEGDIFGIHIPLRSNNSLILYEQRGNGPLNLRVNGNVDAPLSIITATSLRTDNNDFPLVTAVFSKLKLIYQFIMSYFRYQCTYQYIYYHCYYYSTYCYYYYYTTYCYYCYYCYYYYYSTNCYYFIC